VGHLAGTWGTVLLPLRADGAIDFGRLETELEVLLEAGLAGTYTCGTAGEFHALEEAEFDSVSEIVATKSRQAGVPFQLGASHMSAQICLSRVQRARALAPAAIQVVLPDWLPLSTSEVDSAVGRFSEAAGPIPLVLYNPPHAKTRCTTAQLAHLANTFGLAGVKIAEAPAFYEELHTLAPGLLIFVPGHELAASQAPGVAGSYSNVACLAPRGAATWQRQMTDAPADALALGRRIAAFFSAYIAPLKESGFSNTALDKTLATMGGWAPVGTRVRWPYASVPDEVAHRLGGLARNALPELF
jgi:dihydrodipicolinate synthase/N-acetylneuraminate lyase